MKKLLDRISKFFKYYNLEILMGTTLAYICLIGPVLFSAKSTLAVSAGTFLTACLVSWWMGTYKGYSSKEKEGEKDEKNN